MFLFIQFRYVFHFSGTIFGIPHNQSLAGLTVFVSVLDKNEDLTVDLGEIMINLTENSDNPLSNLSSTPFDACANITRNKGRERVGKIVYKLSRISIFADGSSRNNFKRKNVPERDRTEELNVLSALPDFQFNRLVKPVHWERLKGLNLDR